MSANPIENNATPKTTGSLEELFRHHLGEEAAVPPRPVLWDHIDNSLLIRQNETYRRRLVATRWVAAASLLLATLAGTGWWAGRTGVAGGPEMATNTGRPAPAGAHRNEATARPGFGTPGNAGSNGNAGLAGSADGSGDLAAATGLAAQEAATGSPDGKNPGSIVRRGGLENSATSALAVAPARRAAGRGLSQAAATLATGGRPSRTGAAGDGTGSTAPTGAAVAVAGTIAATTAPQVGSVAVRTSSLPAATLGADAATSATGAIAIGGTAPATGAGATRAMGSTGAGAQANAAAASVSAATLGIEQAGLLASRTVALGAVETPAPALPGTLAAGPEPTELAPGTHRWQYGASYTASAFNPNINFSRAGIDPEFGYNPVLGPAELSEQAATEYHQNLRAGFSQRLALTVARRLRGHWSVGTGVELAKANARSTSTVAFVGEQLADGGQTVGSGPRRATDFSYTLASLPLELRYSNPAKRGWSLYGRLGGVVSALLGNRSEVAGRPEVTQTYSITSASTPYRRLTSSVRGAAGARFSLGAGHWALSMGPVAELGLVSLNAHPVQSYFAQSHPYSVGLEAAVEFGR